jgi:cell wall-associated NlpC family hydrolase
MFDASIIQAVRDHAIAEYPKESCGVVTLNGYKPCNNIHPEPLNNFKISGRVIAPLLKKGELLAVVHSHPNGPNHPSKADMQAQLNLGVAFGITVTEGEGATDPIWWGGNTPMQPLIGRPFVHGVTDCLALIRDYYKSVLDIQIKDYARTDAWWDQGQNSENMYLDLYSENGFRKVKPKSSDDDVIPQTHDLVFMRIRSNVVNHAAVYLGGDQILHHLSNRLSTDEDSASKWHRQIYGYYRHESLFEGDNE